MPHWALALVTKLIDKVSLARLQLYGSFTRSDFIAAGLTLFVKLEQVSRGLRIPLASVTALYIK